MYYKSYENSVGEGVDWSLLNETENSHEYNKLKILKGINALNTGSFNDKFLNLNNLKELQNDNLILEELNDSPRANSSTFPDEKFKNINKRIENLYDDTIALYNQWNTQILDDIKEKQDQIDILDNKDKEIINKIVNNNKLPEDINKNTINAINNLLKDIKIEEINIKDLYKELTKDKDTIKVNELKKIVDKFIENKTKDSDPDKLRFRITNGGQ
jgi:hypothetical protein